MQLDNTQTGAISCGPLGVGKEYVDGNRITSRYVNIPTGDQRKSR